jgi:hypothetical protein
MSLGAITLAAGLDSPGGPTPVFADRLSFAGDDSYPTGGSLTFQTLVQAAVAKGGREIVAVIAEDCGLFLPVYDKATDALKVRNLTDGTEVTATTDLSTTTFNVVVLSK